MAQIKLAEYTFDNTVGDVLPSLTPSNIVITTSDTVNGNITTRVVHIDNTTLPTKISFNRQSGLLTLSYLNVGSNITDMNDMFQLCSKVTSINASGWNTSNVTGMGYLFQACGELLEIKGLNTWNTSKVQYMNQMFIQCYKLTDVSGIQNWDVSSVLSLAYMFGSTNSLTGELDLSKWRPVKLTSTQNMFVSSNLVSVNLKGWNVPNLTNMTSMFAGHSTYPLQSVNMSNWTTSSAINMNSTFYNCPKLNTIDFTNSKIVCSNLSQTFQACSSLTSLDLSGFNTSNTTTTANMFQNCTSLQSLDLSNFDTTNVNRMNGMFYNCSSLQTLDISSFNTKKASPALYHMFYNCSSLRVLDFSNFDSSSGLDFNTAFNGCRFEQIGLLYSSATSINDFANRLRPNYNCEIYYLDADPSELTPINNITYIQYKENVLYLPPTLTLRSNGDIHDEYSPFTSQFVRRIGEDGSVLENPVIATVKSIVAYNDTVKYGYALPDKTTDLYHPEVESYEQVIDSTTLNGTENWTKVNQTTFTTPFTNAKSETSTEVFTMKDDVESITIVNDTLSLIFKETSYVTTNNIAVNALKIWLQTNNIEFKYELKDHVFTDMTLEEFDFDNAHFVKPQAYKGGVMTQSNKDDLIFAPITYQTKSNNRYELPLLDSNSDYTLHYEGSVSEVDLGGSTNSSVESNSLVQSGSSDKVVLFDDEVSNVMLIKGDVREQTIPYFQGLLSTQAPALRTISDNVYDGDNTMELGAWTAKGENYTTTTEIRCKNNFTPFPKELKNGDTMYIVLSDTSINSNTNMHVYDEDKKQVVTLGYGGSPYIEGTNFINGVSTIVVHDTSKCKYFSFRAISTNTNCKFALMINKVGAYADHKTSILSTPKDLELHSVGDDCDVLDCKTGELHRYYGKLIIDGSEKFEWHGMNDGVYGFNLSQNEVNKKLNNRINPHKPSTCNSLEYRGSTMYNKKGEGFAISDADHAIVQVQLSLDRLPKLSEDGLRQYLSENPLHLIVPLLNPIVETVDLDIEYKEGDKKYIVRTHDDVTHVNVSSEGLAPITEIGYIANEDNVETVTLEDGMVTLENAKPHSVIQRAFMTGQTLVNISKFESNIERTSIGASQIIQSNDVTMLKTSTTYTFIYWIESTSDTYVGNITTLDGMDEQMFDRKILQSSGNLESNFILKFSQTSRDFTGYYGLKFSGLNGSVKLVKSVILEGDYTDVDIPYFTGMQSVKLPVLKTTGKNLFNFDDYEWKQGGLNDAGNQGTTPSHSSFINTDKVPIEKLFMSLNKKAYLTCERSNSGGWVQIFFYDKDGKTCGRCLNHGQQIYLPITINVPTNAKFFRMQLATDDLSSVVATYDKADCIPYTQHKSNILTVDEDVELRGIGDVKDELNLITGELTQRFGEIVFDGGENWISSTVGSSGTFMRFYTIVQDAYLNEQGSDILCDRFTRISHNNWNTDIEGIHSKHTAIHINILTSKLESNDASGFKKWLSSNPVTVCYLLATESIKTVDLTLTQQNVPSEKMTYFKDYYGQLVSDGTLPKFTYRLESTNTYNVSQLKPNTLYTMYSEGEATVATLGGKASILLNNPQTLTSGTQNKSLTFDSPTSKVVLIEKDVTNQVVPYFTGTLDTVNPIIKTTSGNKSNTVSTNVYLRSVGDVCDTYDLNTGTLVKRVGEDHRVLDHPETSNIPVNTPLAYHGATVEMSSNELSLLPRFEYSCKSPNYYPLPVESNEVYTLKFDKTSNGTLTMGGVTANTTGNQTITTKNSDVQGVLFSEDLGIGNLMVMKTDVRNVPTPYFRGIRSVVNPTITVSDGGTQSNSVALTLTMRSLPNGVKDELNLVTGEYVQRLDQRNFTEGDANSRDMITDGTTTIYPLTLPRRSTLELNWSDGVLTAYDGTTNITSEAELLKPHLFFQLATSTLEEIISQLKDENASLLETVATLEEDNLSTMVAVTEVFETVLVMMPMTLSVNNDTKGGGSYMVEVYVTLILKGKKTLEQVPAVIRPQVEQMLKDVDAL